VSKVRKLSKEYLSPQKPQKAAVFFIQKNLDLKMIKNFNKFKNTYYICTHSKSLKLHGIPPPKMPDPGGPKTRGSATLVVTNVSNPLDVYINSVTIGDILSHRRKLVKDKSSNIQILGNVIDS
jgi:hypothetical protein